jgi:23S rRNA (pseudouridine1915-N3)-methyltransferase
MLLRIVAVGSRMPAWVEQAVDDYTRRMPPEIRVEWRAVKAEGRQAGGSARQWQEREATRIRDAIPPGARLVVLDERGDDVDSAGLAARLSRWQAGGTAVALVIGGPDGIEPGLKASAHESMRLSSLTLAHPLVRVVLAEQLYRAWSINAGHPYHRD